MTHLTPAVAAPVPDYGHPPGRRPWSAGRLLGWGFGTVVGVGVVGSVLLPNLCKSTETAQRAKCSSNLHQIGLAILLYQQDHGGAYPDTLGRLAENEQIGAEVFVCPSGNDERSDGATPAAVAADIDAGPAKHHCSYVYVGRGLTDKTETAATVVAYDPLSDHDDDGGNVLYGDGRVDWQAHDRRSQAPWPATRPAEGRP